MSDQERLTARQRFTRAGVVGLMVNAPLCWVGWLTVLKVSPSTAVVPTTLTPLVIAILAVAVAMFGTFGIKGLAPIVTPIRVARSQFRKWVVLWIVFVVVSVVLGLAVFSRVDPPSGAGLLGGAARLADGRYALVSHGTVIRYLSSEEYRELLTSEMLGMIAVVLALSLAFTAFLASRLWYRTDEDDPRSGQVSVQGHDTGV